MTVRPNHNAHQLQTALNKNNSRSLAKAISQLQSSLPQEVDSTAISNCIEEIRSVADILIEACDFDTAFETAVFARTALIQARILTWAVSVLKNFSFDERVISRIALALAHLGIGAESRGQIGDSGAVDQLAILWKTYPSSYDIVHSLVSLCAGHIDNMSRVMRRRGISTAIKILLDPRNTSNSKLVERTMVLIGLCSICIPENRYEASTLVPAILVAWERMEKRKRTATTQHALICIANIADCWTKENTGYDLGKIDYLVRNIAESWKKAPRCKEMAFTASWALSALYARDPKIFSSTTFRENEIVRVIKQWKDCLKSSRFVYNLIPVSNQCLLEAEQKPTSLEDTNFAAGAEQNEANETELENLSVDNANTLSEENQSEPEIEETEESSSDDLTEISCEPDVEATGDNNTVDADPDMELLVKASEIGSDCSSAESVRRAKKSERNRSPPMKAQHRQTPISDSSSNENGSSKQGVVVHKSKNEVYRDTEVRRSKRTKRPNSKYACEKPRKTRRLARHGLASKKQILLPLVSSPSVLPCNWSCEVIAPIKLK